MKTLYTFPPFHEHRLANGLKMVYIPDDEQNALTMAIQIPHGRFCDEQGVEGLAELTVGLLQKGCAGRSTNEFARAIEYHGASFYGEVNDEFIIIGFKSLEKFADTIIDLFWQMIVTPAFFPEELKRLKREAITVLQSEQADAMSVATRHFYAQLFGSIHPAGRQNTSASIKKITLESIRTFHKQRITPRESVLVIAGAFNFESYQSRYEPMFASWQVAAAPNSASVAPAAALTQTRIRLLHKADLTQTSLIVGHGAPGEAAPERNALSLANYILGGGNFSSRLMEKIRTATGKTYGISSQVASGRMFGAFMITTATRNEQLSEVLASIVQVYRQLAADGITDNELERAKKYTIGNMAFQLEGIGNIVDKILWLHFFGRHKSYIEQFGQMIASLTSAEINRSIRAHLSSPYFIICAAGNAPAIEGVLANYGLVERVGYRSLL